MSECVLYRHFTKGGKLLYVGVSKNALARIAVLEQEVKRLHAELKETAL